MSAKPAISRPKSKFLEVECKDCGNKQIIFNKASTVVLCQVCGATLAIPRGGKAIIKANITGVLE